MGNRINQAYSRRETLRMSVGGALAAVGAGGAAAAGQGAGGETGLAGTSKKIETAEPPVKARMFWTWDHSTEWWLNIRGAQTIGASNDYMRTKAGFETDYTKMLEFCGRHHIDAVVIWGLLRDSHGGIESAKRLCEVAAKNGVRLLAGSGLDAYGGVYYQGESPYSLDLHLQKHPELKAKRKSGEPLEFHGTVFGNKMFYHACHSRKENQEYMTDSLRWLFETLPLDGVEIEAGDTGVCECKLCLERRQHPAGSFSWEDFALVQPMAVEAIRSVKPDAWICCETYSHPERFTGTGHPRFGEGMPPWADACLAKIPDGVFIEWVYDRVGKNQAKRNWPITRQLDRTRHRHILRAHYSTYWNGTRGELAIDKIAEMVQQSTAHGADAMSLFGEVSPFNTGAELNYLALEHFGSPANPKADLEVFLQEVAGPLLGGPSMAAEYFHFAQLKNEPKRIPGALEAIYQRCGRLPAGAARRWAWLGNFLASQVYDET